jgi:hypothetical protein
VKILKHGKLPDDDVFRGTCHYCKTEFECKRHEGKYIDDQRDGPFLEVNCPVCGKKTYAYKRDDGQLIPEHRRDNLSWSGYGMESGTW